MHQTFINAYNTVVSEKLVKKVLMHVYLYMIQVHGNDAFYI